MRKAIKKVEHAGRWSEKENMTLVKAINRFGRNWEKISKESFNLKRNKKQCERHFEYLRSKFNKV
jgi:hypothetical protein